MLQKYLFTARLLIYLIASILLLTISVSAAKISSLEKLNNQINKTSNRARGLAISTLKNIKAHDAQYRLSDGRPNYAYEIEAREELGRIKILVNSFEATVDEFDALAAKFRKLSSKVKGDRNRVEQLKNEVKENESKLKKYQSYIDKFYGKSIRDFGEPIDLDEVQPMVKTSPDDFLISGVASVGLGSAKQNYPNANPEIKSSGSDMNLGAKGTWFASDQTNINAHIDYRNTVVRKKIGLTKLGADVVHQFSPYVTFTGGMDHTSYSCKEDIDANTLALTLAGAVTPDISYFDYGENNLFARVNYKTSGIRLNSGISKISRNYDKFNGSDLNIDYGILSINNNLVFPSANGNINIKFNYLNRTNDVELLDYSEINPGLIWSYNNNSTKLGIDFRSVSYDQVKTENYNKIKVFWVSDKSGLSARGSTELSVMVFNYPDAKERNFYEGRFKSTRYSSGKSRKNNTITLLYRFYPEEGQYDFAQLEWRLKKDPSGTGTYSKINFTGRFYTETGEESDTIAFFSQIRPPHTLDAVIGIGWVKQSNSQIKHYSIGPKVAARMLIDTERDKVFDNDFNKIDFVWQNPQNSVKLGIESRFLVDLGKGATWTSRFEYSVALLYNADPSRNTNLINFDNTISYPINERFQLDGHLNLHRTRADIKSATDLDKFKTGVTVNYYFDIERK